jgi:peptidoglycan hydrolase-like protein with peptidoglycan-binding domain
MKRFSSIRLAVMVAVFALVAAACSSDSTDTTAAAGGATATTAAGASADGGETKTTPAPEGNDIESAIVKEIQTTLTALGYDPGPVDGIYGWGTITALEAFQTDAGITVDGKYGPQTHDALEEAAAETGYDWDKQAAISQMQQEMADLGYYNGEIDGEYGPETEDAIKAVQADCGIPQDGIYGPDTHSCLLDLGGDA